MVVNNVGGGNTFPDFNSSPDSNLFRKGIQSEEDMRNFYQEIDDLNKHFFNNGIDYLELATSEQDIESLEKRLKKLNKGQIFTDNQLKSLASWYIWNNKLEEATQICDRRLARKPDDGDWYLLSGLSMIKDRRFQEAYDAIFSAKHFGTEYWMDAFDQVLPTLEEVVKKQSTENPYQNTGSPRKSHIVIDKNDGTLDLKLDKILKRIKPDEDIILVKDRVGNDYEDLDRIKEKYSDQIRSIETEHQFYENYEDNDRKIRIVLKNNCHGDYEKAIRMGIRKAKGAGVSEFTLDGKNKSHVADDYRLPIGTQKKTHVALFGVPEEVSKGVSTVMDNIEKNLLDDNFLISTINVGFNNSTITYRDEGGNVLKFKDRKTFADYINKRGIRFDIANFHGWHFSDHFKPFKRNKDPTDIKSFIELLGSPKVVHTDHSNPTDDLRRLGDFGHDYEAKTEQEREAFLNSNNLYSVNDWKKGWVQSDFLGRRQMMELSDVVTHVSSTQRDKELDLLPNYDDAGKHMTIWNGTDLVEYSNNSAVKEEAKRLHKKWGGNRGEKIVLYCGRAVKEKGIEDLASAIKKLNERGERTKVVYVGKFNNEQKRKLNAISGQKNIYTGKISKREDLAAHYAAADLIAQPTWGECFNQVVAEGLAMGTPGVVGDISGPHEVYIANNIAIGHTPQDVDSLTDSLHTGLTDTDLREQIIKDGNSFIRKNLTAKHMAKQYGKLYRKLAK